LLTAKRVRELTQLQERLGVRFDDLSILDQALTHLSFAYEEGEGHTRHSQRLEFLGDAVVDLVIADAIFNRFPQASEGEMAKARANLVCENTMAQLSRKLGLGYLLLLGKSEKSSHGYNRPALLADTLEAVIGAVYLNSDWATTYQVVMGIWGPLLEEMEKNPQEINVVLDAKSALQEYLQARTKSTPVYTLQSASGPDHDKTFLCEVRHQGKILAQGRGKSKKEAEQQAAKKALDVLRKSGVVGE
jgi:ribonuclease-3